jgi:hypothetical protein
MEDVVHFFRIAFIQPARNARILSKSHMALVALQRGLLNLLTIEAFDVLYFFEMHAFSLTSLLKLKQLIMAELAGVVDATAGGFNLACIDMNLQFR